MGHDYDRAAGDRVVDPVGWVENEVLTDRPPVKEAIDNFIRMVTREGQAAHNVLRKQLDWAIKNVEGGEKIRDADVIRAVAKHIATNFGDDPLAKAIARSLATGEHLF